MNNADLVKMYRWLKGVDDNVGASAQMMLDIWDSPKGRRLNEEAGELAGLSVVPGMNAWRWMLTLDRVPWIYCHDCGELTTALDDPPLSKSAACECWDTPPPWIVDGRDFGFDPADALELVDLPRALWRDPPSMNMHEAVSA